MAIYEYQCPECKEITELWSDLIEEEPQCKKCETKLVKVISQTSFHLKGSGWARDGYSKE